MASASRRMSVASTSNNFKNLDLHLALFNAVSNGRYRQTKLLVEAGAGVNSTDEFGRTPLGVCCLQVRDHRRLSRIIRLLIDSGADPNVRDEKGRTVIMQAACLGLTDVVTYLLEQSVINLELQDTDGNTVLMHAASSGHSDVVLALLKQMGRLRQVLHLTQRNHQGYTAFELAERNGHYDIVSMLGGTDKPPPLCHTGMLDRGPTPSSPLSFPTRLRLQFGRRKPSRECLLDVGIAKDGPLTVVTAPGEESGSRTTYSNRGFPSLARSKFHGEAIDLNSSYSSTASEPCAQDPNKDFDRSNGGVDTTRDSNFNEVLNRLDLSISRATSRPVVDVTAEFDGNAQRASRIPQLNYVRNYFPPIRPLNKECRSIIAKHKDR